MSSALFDAFANVDGIHMQPFDPCRLAITHTRIHNINKRCIIHIINTKLNCRTISQCINQVTQHMVIIEADVPLFEIVFFFISLETLIIFNLILFIFISCNVQCQINPYWLILCIIKTIRYICIIYQLKIFKISNNINESAEWLYFDLAVSIINCFS